MGLVFQYGSNCDERRLNSPKRLNDAARPIGKAQTAENFEVAFNVWSDGNKCATADLVRCGEGKAWGALYKVPNNRITGPKRINGLRTLAEIEGPRYELQHIRVTIGGKVKSAVTFLVRETDRTGGRATSAKYVSYIIRGMRNFGVPEDYVQRVIDAAVANVESAAKSAVAGIPALERLRNRLENDFWPPPLPSSAQRHHQGMGNGS